MILVNRIDDQITGSYNGKPFGVTFTQQKYDTMKAWEAEAAKAESMDDLQTILEEFELLTHEDYKELVEHSKGGQYLFVNPHTGKIYLAINGKASDKELPKSFVDRIIQSVEKNIDVLPLVKCWTRFLKNPFYSADKAKRFANYINTTFTNNILVEELMEKKGLSKEVATKKATTYDVSITQEGLLCTYKVSIEILKMYVKDEDATDGVKQKDMYDYEVDPITGLKTYKEPTKVEDRYYKPAVMGDGGDAFFCGDKEGHIIRVGKIHYLKDWSMVNTNDSTSCVKGLHCGGLRYIQHFQGPGTVTHQTFVDPMHIGAITDDGTGALRVKQYFTYASFAGVTGGIYHSSEYAKLTDAEYEQMIKEVVEKSEQDIKAIQESVEQKKNLAK